MITPRPVVQGFASEMERKLRAYGGLKGSAGWRGMDPTALLAMLKVEVKELQDAIDLHTGGLVGWNVVRLEAADVANYAMMIADQHEPT